MRRLACLVLVAAVCGCGGDDGGGGSDGPGDALDPVPRQWGAGERLGYALLSHQSKTPTSLTAQACRMDAQLAVASAAGMLPESGSEGSCIVTETTSWVGLADPVPACAGVIQFEFGGSERRLTVCGDAFAPPIDVMCGAVSSADGLRVTSYTEGVDGAMLGSLDALVEKPAVPTIRVPAPQGEGTAVWPEGEGDLRVEWDSQDADGVEVVVGATSGSGPQVRCRTADDGAFDVPAALLAPYRSGTAFVEVAALEQARTDPDGFAFRTTFRVSDAIWLFRR